MLGKTNRVRPGTVLMTILLCSTVLTVSSTSFADSGFFLGGSVGSTTISQGVSDPNTGLTLEFDENDFSWKVFGGYNFDLAIIDLGIEGGYVDLGSPSADILGERIGVSATGWDLFGLAGIELGPFGIFAKAGVIAWDADGFLGDIPFTDDGSDPAYGVGLRFSIASFEIRGEYEYFDIEDSDDVYMLSAGLVWTF